MINRFGIAALILGCCLLLGCSEQAEKTISCVEKYTKDKPSEPLSAMRARLLIIGLEKACKGSVTYSEDHVDFDFPGVKFRME